MHKNEEVVPTTINADQLECDTKVLIDMAFKISHDLKNRVSPEIVLNVMLEVLKTGRGRYE